MTKTFVIVAAVALITLSIDAWADVFNLGSGFTNLETVLVGDPGNVGELSGMGVGGVGKNRICGAVDYNYRISKYEITAKQYCDFLNHKAKSDPYGLYTTKMDQALWPYNSGCNIIRSGSEGNYEYTVEDYWANRPVNFVSYWSAYRFANWLSNGQGNGDTETGSYTLDGYNGYYGININRNSNAKWAIPSEDEWYKAAYYKGGGTNAGYWDYPTQSDIAPSNQVIDPDPGNGANFYSLGYPYRTNVGEYENSESAYGTFDQGGNLWEWNESIRSMSSATERYLRGGSAGSATSHLAAWNRGFSYLPNMGGTNSGFRVSLVPEPTATTILLGGLISLLCVKRRKTF